MGIELCIHKTIEGYSNIILTDMGSLVLQGDISGHCMW